MTQKVSDVKSSPYFKSIKNRKDPHISKDDFLKKSKYAFRIICLNNIYSSVNSTLPRQNIL